MGDMRLRCNAPRRTQIVSVRCAAAPVFDVQSPIMFEPFERKGRHADEDEQARMEMAVELLHAPAALAQLSREDAHVVVSFMRICLIREGAVFIREGDTEHTGYMVLVLDGEVTVENIVVSRSEPVTVTVLGEGAVLGEMGLLDGSPRSVSCKATSDVLCAVLTRAELQRLFDQHPQVGIKFMTALCIRSSDRLRDLTGKLRRYVRLTQTLQEEIDRLLPHR